MYLFMDTETGGLTPKHSLLTVSCIATDADFNIVPIGNHSPGIHLRVRHDEYALTAGALSVNKIDIVEHNRTAFDLPLARQHLKDYIQRAAEITNKKRLVPAGHNVNFDVQFIRAYLLSDVEWNEFFTYPFLDTAAIARFFNAGRQYSGGYSLTALRDKFLPHMREQSMHNAENDNLVTIELARKFTSLFAAQT
jgi:DNA polymerase III epsilon subunit-like protein